MICFVRGSCQPVSLHRTDQVADGLDCRTDDAPESLQWEKEYIADDEVASLSSSSSLPREPCEPTDPADCTVMKDNAVALRLAAGSQEPGFLASFCPITKLPTVVAIRCV